MSGDAEGGGSPAIANWYAGVHQTALEISDDIAARTRPLDVHVGLRRVLDGSLGERFGASAQGALPLEQGNLYAKWLTAFWARRCLCFVSQLARGLEEAKRLPALVNARGDVEALDVLRSFEEKLRAAYGPRRSVGRLGIKAGVPIEIANHHATYLDPTLFSSLLLLEDERGRLDSIQAGALWDTVANELARYTGNGHGKRSEIIADESTVWWGVVALLDTRKDKFTVGDRSGYRGAVSLCESMLQEPIKWPGVESTWYEATFDIHGELRTRLFVLKNMLRLVKILPEEIRWELSSGFIDAMRTHLVTIAAMQSVRSHVYFMGLALEVISAYIAYRAEAENEAKRLVTVPGSQHSSTVDEIRATLERRPADRGSGWAERLKSALRSIEVADDRVESLENWGKRFRWLLRVYELLE